MTVLMCLKKHMATIPYDGDGCRIIEKRGQKETFLGVWHGNRSKGLFGRGESSPASMPWARFFHHHTRRDQIRSTTLQFHVENSSAERARVLREEFVCVILC